MTLHNSTQNIVKQLTAAPLTKTLAGMRGNFDKGIWLGKSNRYSKDTADKIESEMKVKGGFISRPKQLAQYISVSPLLHTSDGWSYLGKAVLAILKGDPHRARHLAYYAELRAAMAIMASMGVGIFSQRHFVVDDVDSVKALVQSPTHSFTWDLFEFWASQPASGDFFIDTIRPLGRTLESWLRPIGGGGTVASQASAWFLQWGMDLQIAKTDRSARNVSSYRPDGIPSSWYINSSDALTFVQELWKALEPSTVSQFEEIDTHILHLSLKTAFYSQYGKRPSAEKRRFGEFVLKVVEHQALGTLLTDRWHKSLLRGNKEFPILDLTKSSPNLLNFGHLAVIARATMLLRMASGATVGLLRSAGFDSSNFLFWREGLAQGRGISPRDQRSNETTDLWADIAAILEDVDVFKTMNAHDDRTFYEIGNKLGSAFSVLSSCERVALWSMTP